MPESGHDGVAAPAQERLWLVDAAAPGSPTYNVPMLLTWRGRVDVDALGAALTAVAERHAVLRTAYRLDGSGLRQVVLDAVPVEPVERRGDPTDDDLVEEGRRPFDLSSGRPLRCAVWRGADVDRVLVTIHHIAFDGWSMRPFFADLAAAYRSAASGGAVGLAPPRVDYLAAARAEREHADSDETRRAVDARAAVLAPHVHDVEAGPRVGERDPVDGARPGAQHRFRIDSTVRDAVRAAAVANRATPYVLLLAVYGALVARWGGRGDVVLGTIAANRPHHDVDDVVGFFVNTVPLICRIDPDDTVASLIARTRTEAFGTLRHQRLPYEAITARLGGAATRIGFAWQNMPPITGDGLALWERPSLVPTRTAKFDLLLIVEEDDDGIDAVVEYDTDCYDADRIAAFADAYAAMLAASVDTATAVRDLPSGADSTLRGQTRDLVAEATGGAMSGDAAAPGLTVLDLVSRRLSDDPGRVVVAHDGGDLTARDLDERSNAVAAALRDAGIGPGDVVGVLADRGPWLPVAWLGVLRAGAAYLPLALDTPTARVRFELDETGAPTVLVDEAGERTLGGDGPKTLRIDLLEPVEVATRPAIGDGDTAVVVYTSGTSGRPKGVRVTHRGLLNTACWWSLDSRLSIGDKLLCTWGSAFDGATFDTFRALIGGAVLEYADDAERRDAGALLRRLRGPRGATVSAMTPSLLREVLDAAERSDADTTLRLLYVGGEAVTRVLAERCRSLWPIELRNVYGPTETACVATVGPIDPGDGAPPIGGPLPNTRVHVLGPDLGPVPPGVPGELCVAGVGVASGYLDRPEQEAAVFPADPERPGERLYRTGDRAVVRDGVLHYLGRVDDQVKILGNRIEPAEVARLMEEHPSVRSAIVVAVGAPARLAAFVELADGAAVPDHDAVVAPLTDWLPLAVLPSRVDVVARVPRTANDKVDVAALLAEPAEPLPRLGGGTVLTPGERAAADLMAECLAEAGVDLDVTGLPAGTSFFTVGGHSMLAVRLVETVRARTGASIAVGRFVADPTIAGLARLIASSTPTGADRVVDETDVEATAIMRRLWFVDRLPHLRAAYVVPVLLRCAATVDPDLLRRACDLVLARHPALRARFRLDRATRTIRYRTDGEPATTTVHTGDVDLADLAWRPLDLASGPPARAIVAATDDGPVLLLAAHHVVTDGWSTRILLDQIAAAHDALARGATPDLPPPGHPALVGNPADIPPERIEDHMSRLSDAPTDIDLPHDRPRPSVQDTRGAVRTARLGADVSATLADRASAAGASPFMIAVCLLASSLAGRGDQRDFLFAFPWSGRGDGSETVGMFVDTGVVRADLRGEPTWTDLVSRVADAARDAYAHADVPFDVVAASLHPDRDLGRPPVTPVYVTADAEIASPTLGGEPTVVALPDERHVKFEWELTLVPGAEWELSLAYSTALFDESTVDAALADLVEAARRLAADPDAPAVAVASTVAATAVEAAWCAVLGVDAVAHDVNFFDAGGDSLLLIMLMDELAPLTDREIGAADLFAHPTIAAQTAFLAGGADPEPVAPAPAAPARGRLINRQRRDVAAVQTGPST